MLEQSSAQIVDTKNTSVRLRIPASFSSVAGRTTILLELSMLTFSLLFVFFSVGATPTRSPLSLSLSLYFLGRLPLRTLFLPFSLREETQRLEEPELAIIVQNLELCSSSSRVMLKLIK